MGFVPRGWWFLFLFGFTLISPLCAESLGSSESVDSEESRDEEPLPNEDFFFFEEYFLFDEPLFFDEALLNTEPFPEEPAPGKEPLLSEGPVEKPSLDGSSLDESSKDEPALLSEEPVPYEDLFPDDEGFFFEAPPLIIEAPTFETRSLNAIFPKLSRVQRRTARSEEGLRHYFGKDGSPMLTPDPESGVDLFSSVMAKKPSHIIEAMVIVPYNQKEFDLLDIYNALGKIENIKDQITYYEDYEFNIFTESTRLASARDRKSIPDPPPADMLPYSDTMYVRLKDQFFGNLYIRGDVSISLYGITYNMTNFTDVRYLLVPVIKAERCAVIIYLEPVKEGVLIYSMTGFYLPGLIADRVNLTPNINRRIAVFLNWITDGLRQQEEE